MGWFVCIDCHNTHNCHIASLIRNVLIEQIQLSELMRMKSQAVNNCSVQELYLSRCSHLEPVGLHGDYESMMQLQGNYMTGNKGHKICLDTKIESFTKNRVGVVTVTKLTEVRIFRHFLFASYYFRSFQTSILKDNT